MANPSHTYEEEGSYTAVLTVSNSASVSSSDSVTITVLGNGTPFLGEPFAIPGVIEAEHYDSGVEGVAYHDADAVNWGVPFRGDEGVDLEGASDGGYDIGWIQDGEWVEFTVDVAENGFYNIIPQTASVPGGGALHIEFNSQDLTGEVSIPVTGGWQFWEDVEIPAVELNAGVQVMHMHFYNGQFNLNKIIIESVTSISDEGKLMPLENKIHQNFPNPFNPSTTLRYSLTDASHINLSIYDVRGRRCRNLVDQVQGQGNYSVIWDGLDESGHELKAGIYFCHYRSDNANQTIKLHLLR